MDDVKRKLWIAFAGGFLAMATINASYSAAATLVSIVVGNTAVSASNPLPVTCVLGC